MISHKTNGDWTDVTSAGRNEVVFEGRHKAYGAYAMRQRYKSALLIALLTSISMGVIAAGIPMLINAFSTNIQPTDNGPKENAHPLTFVQHIDKKVQEKPKTAAVVKPKVEKPEIQKKDNPPIIVKDNPDKTNTNTQINDTKVGSTDVDKGDKKNDPTDVKKDDKGTGTGVVIQEQVYKVAQEMPKFEKLQEYISKHSNYPEELKELNIGGTVWTTFVVEPDGTISDIKILKASGTPQLDSEAMSVLRKMPKWTPGKQDGHNVAVQLNLPIRFQVN